MKIIYLLFFVLFSAPSWAEGLHGEVEDLSELALLPTFCRGTQQVRTVSNDPKPWEEYVALYGKPYIYLHHYCWALNNENQLSKIRDENNRKGQLNSILGNLEYVLNFTPSDFSFFPDIYISRARILFRMERDVDAVGVLFKLTQLRPEYGPAYAQLGDYYQRIGDPRNAIKFYQQGLINTHQGNANFFIQKIKKLDKNYKTPPISARKTKASTPDPKPDPTSKENADKIPSDLSDQIPPAMPASSPVPDSAAQPSDQAAKPNPYCRFCP